MHTLLFAFTHLLTHDSCLVDDSTRRHGTVPVDSRERMDAGRQKVLCNDMLSMCPCLHGVRAGLCLFVVLYLVRKEGREGRKERGQCNNGHIRTTHSPSFPALASTLPHPIATTTTTHTLHCHSSHPPPSISPLCPACRISFPSPKRTSPLKAVKGTPFSLSLVLLCRRLSLSARPSISLSLSLALLSLCLLCLLHGRATRRDWWWAILWAGQAVLHA